MNDNKAWYIALGVIGVVLFIAAVGFTLLGIPVLQNGRTVESFPISPRPISPQPITEDLLVEDGQTSTAEDRTVLETINEYYQTLPFDLARAYAMRAKDDVSFETFQEWYGRVKFVILRNPVGVDENTYQFFVDMAEQDPYELSLYAVVMKVEEGKVRTISSEKKEGEQLLLITGRPGFGGEGATLMYDGGVERVFVQDAEGQREIASYDRREDGEEFSVGFYTHVTDLGFSPLGTYLSVQVVGWEAGSLDIYDVATGEMKTRPLLATATVFASDESWYADCGESGMGEGFVRVFDLPSWNLRYEFKRQETEAVGTCSVDEKNEYLDFDVVSWDAMTGEASTRSLRYDIDGDALLLRP